jgi:hypothetical protein
MAEDDVHPPHLRLGDRVDAITVGAERVRRRARREAVEPIGADDDGAVSSLIPRPR